MMVIRQRDERFTLMVLMSLPSALVQAGSTDPVPVIGCEHFYRVYIYEEQMDAQTYVRVDGIFCT